MQTRWLDWQKSGKNVESFRKSVVAHRKGFSCEEEDSNCITDSVKMAQTLTPGITLPYLNAYLFMWCRCTRQREGTESSQARARNSQLVYHPKLISNQVSHINEVRLRLHNLRKMFRFWRTTNVGALLVRDHP